MAQQFLLLAEEENNFSPTSGSRRSLAGQQYNSSTDARDTNTVEVQPQIINEQQQPPPLREYNASNDELGLLQLGLSPESGNESGINEELLSSDVPIDQNNLVEVETVLAEPTVTTTTVATTVATVGVEDITTIATSTPPTYFYICNDDSYSGSNNNSDIAGNLTNAVSSSAVGKQLLRFDYDLLIASTLGHKQQQEDEDISMESVYSMVHQFETRLLETVGLELSMNKSLFCNNSGDGVNVVQLETVGDDLPIVSGQEQKGGEDAILSRRGDQRSLQSSPRGSVVRLSKISSLPADDILNGKCKGEWMIQQEAEVLLSSHYC